MAFLWGPVLEAKYLVKADLLDSASLLHQRLVNILEDGAHRRNKCHADFQTADVLLVPRNHNANSTRLGIKHESAGIAWLRETALPMAHAPDSKGFGLEAKSFGLAILIVNMVANLSTRLDPTKAAGGAARGAAVGDDEGLLAKLEFGLDVIERELLAVRAMKVKLVPKGPYGIFKMVVERVRDLRQG